MGDQTFSVADPELRNTLARHLAATISLSLLWSHVQTFYFQLALPLSSYTVSVLLLLLYAAVLFVSCFLKKFFFFDACTIFLLLFQLQKGSC